MCRRGALQRLRASLQNWWHNSLGHCTRRQCQQPEDEEESQTKTDVANEHLSIYLAVLKDAMHHQQNASLATIEGFVNPCFMTNMFTPTLTRRYSL
ncbi:Ba228.1 [Baboon cytomegalovirus]|nr:Ba228.1 [Baboon cytomegalovirus]